MTLKDTTEMEENEQLEEAGHKVTTGNENAEGPNTQEDPAAAAGEIGIPEASSQGSTTDPDQDDEASLPSDNSANPMEGDDSIPDISKVKENPDSEPGVPDQDF
jgi:hypothetical protein